MFEFITISNGVAVVQHSSSGHVFRFRPLRPGHWNRLKLDKIDPHDADGSTLDDHIDLARKFAEETATAVCREPAEDPWPSQAPGFQSLVSRARFRFSGAS